MGGRQNVCHLGPPVGNLKPKLVEYFKPNFLLLNFPPAPATEAFDAFNEDTFGDGLGDEWNEDAHEALAAMTEEEMKAVQARRMLFPPLTFIGIGKGNSM